MPPVFGISNKHAPVRIPSEKGFLGSDKSFFDYVAMRPQGIKDLNAAVDKLARFRSRLISNYGTTNVPQGAIASCIIEDRTCCFIAGTKVTMKDGSYRDIETVQLGEEILCYDEGKGIVYVSPVIESQHHEAEPHRLFHFQLSNETRFTSNDIHPIFVQNSQRYVRAAEIDKLLRQQQQILFHTEKGLLTEVTRIDLEERSVPLFNLQVKGVNERIGNNYFANGVLVSE
jgi:hypothetical protein